MVLLGRCTKYRRPLQLSITATPRPSDLSGTYETRLSALFCIQPVFLHDPKGTRHGSGHWARHLQLACSSDAETPSVLTWCSGLRPGQIAGHLEALGLAAAGSTRTDEASANYATMTLGGVVLEMYRRHLCTRCHIDRTFAPAPPNRVAA
jgi:hypothetical protein